jgi:hypothetical protein
VGDSLDRPRDGIEKRPETFDTHCGCLLCLGTLGLVNATQGPYDGSLIRRAKRVFCCF